MLICSYDLCNNQLSNKKSKYCSITCSSSSRTKTRIDSWIDGSWDGSTSNGSLSNAVRKYLLVEANYTCSACGWDEINPSLGYSTVEIDHIDGDYSNNLKDNLRVVCPNCHSLTPTYKSLNPRGRGTRPWRKNHDQFKAKNNRGPVTKYYCECGKEVSSKSVVRCVPCRKQYVRDSVVYPELDDIIDGVKSLGFRPYAETLGKSDNAVRKHLIRNGIDPKELLVRGKVFCFCGVEIDNRRKLCDTHKKKPIVFPPPDVILVGIEEYGITKYSAMIGIHRSNVRRHLNKMSV